MADRHFLTQRDGAIHTLTFNRPGMRNALSLSTLLDLRAHLEELRKDQDVRVLILTGAGDRAFCAGADLKERPSFTEEQVREFIVQIRGLMDDIDSHPCPVIAAINGDALGGGTEMALAADLRIVAESARMGLTECRLAIIPGAGGTQRLPRVVGFGKAKELIFTGRMIDAREALRIGLATEVVPLASLLDRCREVAAEICECGPVAIRQAKKAINGGYGVPLAAGLALESECYNGIVPTQDRLEALAAFREKRKPRFQGR